MFGGLRGDEWTYCSPFAPSASTNCFPRFSLMAAIVTLALEYVGVVYDDVPMRARHYPFSAKLEAIKAPSPEAPPVTSTDLSRKMEKSKILVRSAICLIMAFDTLC